MSKMKEKWEKKLWLDKYTFDPVDIEWDAHEAYEQPLIEIGYSQKQAAILAMKMN